MKTSRLLFFKALVSALFIVVVVLSVSRHELTTRLGEIHPGFAAVCLLWSVVMIGASCLKWSMLLRLQGSGLPFLRLMRIYFIGYLFTNLLPSNVGGDVARSYLAGRDIGDQPRAAVSVFVERFSGILFLLGLVVLAPLAAPALYGRLRILLPALGAAGLLVVFGVLMRRPSGQGSDGLRGFLSTHLGRSRSEEAGVWRTRYMVRIASGLDRALSAFDRFSGRLGEAMGAIKTRAGNLLGIAALTALFYLLTWVNVWLAYRVFGVSVPFRLIVAVVPTVMLISMIPVSLGSLGLAEGAYVFYGLLMGATPTEAALMALFLRFKIIVTGLVGLVAYVSGGERVGSVEEPEGPGEARADRPARSGGIQSELAAGGGQALAGYQRTVVGRPGFAALVRHEALTTLLGSLPGSFGIAMRRIGYRFLFRTVGCGTSIGRNVALRCPGSMSIGDRVRIADDAALQAAGGEITIERNVAIGQGTILNCRGGKMIIREGAVIGARCRLGSLKGLDVGTDVVVGDEACLSGAAHATDRLDVPIIRQPLTCRGPTVVGEGARIGARTTVLDGMALGAGSRVGESAFVNRPVEAGASVGGVPAGPADTTAE